MIDGNIHGEGNPRRPHNRSGVDIYPSPAITSRRPRSSGLERFLSRLPRPIRVMLGLGAVGMVAATAGAIDSPQPPALETQTMSSPSPKATPTQTEAKQAKIENPSTSRTIIPNTPNSNTPPANK